MDAAELRFDEHGAERHLAHASGMMAELETVLSEWAGERPGVRIHGSGALAATLSLTGAIGSLAADRLGPSARPVRAILFDKTPATNWSLGWHQDRTIAVREQCDVAGFGPWSRKAGVIHVEPPFAFVAGMITLRIHLDDVPDSNAPLLIAPGSHRLGRIAESDVASTVSSCGTATCLAQRGDVWAYSTPILHASAAVVGHSRRRVLQVDYAAEQLPEPLAWLGIG